MSIANRTAAEVLEREFLEVRAKILEIGASLDRLDRANGDVAQERRRELIQQGLKILLEMEPARAERIQLLFSRPYESNWPSELDVTLRS
ncbi:MAG: hypothetical protein KDA92_25625 [Planctomycetales bacterium]|nr:hypothetical protein [Planctomycetales bacterium]